MAWPGAIRAQQVARLDPLLRELRDPGLRAALALAPLGPAAPLAQRPFGGTVALDRQAPGAEPRVGVLIMLADPAAVTQLAAVGVDVGVQMDGIVTAWVPLGAIDAVAALPSVVRVEAARGIPAVTDSSMRAIRVDVLRAVDAQGDWSGLTGSDAIIGIYDSGLDFRHEDFLDPSGQTRVLALWDQFSEVVSPPPGYEDGLLCTRAAIQSVIDGAGSGPCPQEDRTGHGTHVAGIAGGDGSAGSASYQFAGVAPEAELLIVNGGPGVFFENDIIEGLAWIREQANALGKPAVVNLSLGGQFGAHDGSRLYEQAIDALSGPGFIVVIAAGNSGSNLNTTPPSTQELIHARGSASGLDTREFTFDVCRASSGPGCLPYTPSTNPCTNRRIEFGFWSDADDRLRVEVQRPNGTLVAAQYGELIESDDPEGQVTIDNVSEGLSPLNGDNEATIILSGCGTSGSPGAGTWRLRVAPTVSGSGAPYDFWLERNVIGQDGAALGGSGFDNNFITTSPGNATRAITVGAFATRMCWPSSTGTGGCYLIREEVGDLARFSSAGPRRDGLQKPDITAPGIGVVSALSTAIVPTANRVTTDGLHWILEGTSMAAPHVTGTIALLYGLRPTMSPEEARLILTSSAAQDGFTTGIYGAAAPGAMPADWWGAGKLDAEAAVLSIGMTGATIAIQTSSIAPADVTYGALGERLPLLALKLDNRGAEPIRVLRVGFDFAGPDPDGRLQIIRDVDGNGAIDGTDRVLGAREIGLDGGPERVYIAPDTLTVPPNDTTTVLIAVELSGAAPHGATFAAELDPEAFVSIGEQTLGRNPVEAIALAGSGPAETSVLRPERAFGINQNPVREPPLLLTFERTPDHVGVYTPSGRLVTDLTARVETGGLVVQWDLTNDQGTRVAPGVYLLVVVVDGKAHTLKLVMLPTATASEG